MILSIHDILANTLFTIFVCIFLARDFSQWLKQKNEIYGRSNSHFAKMNLSSAQCELLNQSCVSLFAEICRQNHDFRITLAGTCLQILSNDIHQRII